ncbi:unnamed protein product [Debaryomyces tyrocola]|nr:unnamed protein product [Debaryomyces tyrocola]
MFTFSIITPSTDDYSCKASLLSFDNDIKILADPSWNGNNHEDILYMEQYLKEVDIILLSHSTPEFISGFVLLCIKFPNLMSNIPIYSTLPVNQLGRVSTVEYYRANGVLGPLNNSILEVDEVDEWFDKIIPLKFFQTLSVFDNRLVITPYNAGHTLGGTFWLITRRLEKIIYAPSWNHSKDSFLNSASFLSSSSGNPLSQLMRPTVLITNTDLGSTMSHKKRTEKFLNLVDATLANGGAVLLPTSLSGRFLELLHLIDQHLQSAPIPVYFLSYSGTKVLSYASNLLEWMSSQLVKEWEEASSVNSNSSNKNNFPFDPSKVDLLLDPSELVQLSGPKIVFCSGIDFKNGDMSSEALQYLCQDEKTTIVLTEKTHFGLDNTINSQLYHDWYNLTKQKQGGNVEDGVAVPLEKAISLENWNREEPLIGAELTDFQEKINLQRKQKLLAKVRDRKNQNLLNADTINGDDSSSDEEDDVVSSDDEAVALKYTEAPANADASTTANVPAVVKVDELSAHEAFITDHVKQTLEANRPLDLKITHKLKPRQAMFPYIVGSHKQKFDDYGEVIDIKDFQKQEDTSSNKLIMESKRKFEQNEKRKWGNVDNKGKGRGKNSDKDNNNQNKITPQELLNNQLLQKNLDTLFSPRKRVPLNAASSFSSKPQELRMRCGLSFVDLSGLVDMRSLSLIVSSLKPYNLLLLPDFSANQTTIEEMNGLATVKQMFDQQQDQQQQEQNKKSLANSSRYLSLATIRGGISNFVTSKNSAGKLAIVAVQCNTPVKIGGDDSDDTGIGLSNFEIKLDDSIIDSLKWQNIDGSYRVAQVYGELEIHNQDLPNKKQKTISDYMNSSTQFTLKHISNQDFLKQQQALVDAHAATTGQLLNNNGPKLAIGNIRLPELKKKLISRNMNAEFKSEGTLVVNNSLAIRKVTYSSVEGEDTGDIVIDGAMGPLYYEIKDCIREMLAYV